MWRDKNKKNTKPAKLLIEIPNIFLFIEDIHTCQAVNNSALWFEEFLWKGIFGFLFKSAYFLRAKNHVVISQLSILIGEIIYVLCNLLRFIVYLMLSSLSGVLINFSSSDIIIPKRLGAKSPSRNVSLSLWNVLCWPLPATKIRNNLA